MANGTLAASQIEMLSQDGTGTVTITPPATDTNRAITLPDAAGEVVLNSATQTLTNKIIQGGAITSATAVTASGTSVDFTSIPSWVKRITVMFNGVSTNGSSLIQVQLGDAGGIETSTYLGSASTFDTSASAQNYSTGFLAVEGNAASWVTHGLMTLANVSGNLWAESHSLGLTGLTAISIGGGTKTLSDTLTQVRITTVNGTDTFDAGSINIMYEG
jgi:hypothetical protein